MRRDARADGAIGRLAIGRASIRRFSIGELEGGRLRVRELVVDERPVAGSADEHDG